MTRIQLTALLAVAALSGSSALALAQTSSSGVRSLSNSTSSSSTTTTGRSATSVPDPAADPNSQVAPSSVGLPGGATSVPLTSGSGAGQAVPFYGTTNSSVPSVAGSIDESSTRSSSTDCSGTGTRSSTGSGSISATTSNCSSNSPSSSTSLGTSPIMGGSGAVDVSGN